MKNVDLFLSLTDVCNLSCSYCNRHGGKKFIEKKTFEKIIDQVILVYPSQIEYLSIWGGEPLLHPLFDEFIEIIINKFKKYNHYIKISINTNGLLLDKKSSIIKKLLTSLPHIDFKIYISIDGLDAIDNEMRGIGHTGMNGILKTLVGFKSLEKDYKNLIISTSTVLHLSEVNIQKFKAFIDYISSYNINMGFCFQAFAGKNMCVNVNILQSLLSRCNYIKEKGYNYVIEDIKDINKTLRCDAYGDIYNFIDSKFLQSDKFLISKNGELNFLNSQGWLQDVSENELYAILYRNPQYISFLKYIS